MRGKKVLSLLALSAVLAACGSEKKGETKETPELKISYIQEGKLYVAYNRDNPLELPDGRIIRKGENKLVYQEIEKEIGADIKDVAPKSGDTAAAMIELAASRNFDNADIFGGDKVLEKITNYGTQGYFVPINEHLDEMPNVKEYFEKNPGIANQLKAFDGNIYALPYVAEIGNYARLYHLRHDWVEKLLDTDDIEFDTAKEITIKYEPFYSSEDITDLKIYPKKGEDKHIVKNIDKAADNIVDIQNVLAADGTLNGTEAIEALRKYIDEKYMSQGIYEKRSDLFLSEYAAYDVDELVALWRSVKLNPGVLTGDKDANIVVFYARQRIDKEDIMRLVNFFGARSFGSDSYEIKDIVSETGNLEHAWGRKDFTDALAKVSELFEEGLINEDFENYPSGASDFRSFFIRKNVGFMTHDWSASTTIFNDVVKDSKEYGMEDFKLAAILPPVTKYRGEFIQFMENTRALKPAGWGISKNSSEEAIEKALAMFDFIYSREGRNLVNYGVEGITWEGKLEGTDYPKFTEWTFENSNELVNGNVSNFLKYYIGGQMQIGYQKEEGLELQSTNSIGLSDKKMLDASNTIQFSLTNDDPSYVITPTVLPLSEDEADILSEEITIDDYLERTIFLILKNGFGYSDEYIKTPTKEEYIEDLKAAGLERYNSIKNKAYQR